MWYELLLAFCFFVAFNAVVFGGFVYILKRLRKGGPLFAVEDEELRAQVRLAAQTEAASDKPVELAGLNTTTTADVFFSGVVIMPADIQQPMKIQLLSAEENPSPETTTNSSTITHPPFLVAA